LNGIEIERERKGVESTNLYKACLKSLRGSSRQNLVTKTTPTKKEETKKEVNKIFLPNLNPTNELAL